GRQFRGRGLAGATPRPRWSGRAAARIVPVPAGHPPGRVVAAVPAGALAARPWPQPVPADRPAAAPARRHRIAGHAGGDGLIAGDDPAPRRHVRRGLDFAAPAIIETLQNRAAAERIRPGGDVSETV